MSKKMLYTGIVYSTDSNVRLSVTEDENIVTLSAKEQLLLVRLDTKHRGGKVVTLIEGFSGTVADIETLGKQLKTYCGTGGSVKNSGIIIQGDNREKIVQWLHKNGFLKAKKV